MPCMRRLLLLVAAALLAVPAAESAAVAPAPLQIDKPLLAYWDFDDQFGDTCRDQGKNGYHAAPESAQALDRTEGVFGGALRLAGSHKLRVPEKPDFAGVKRISFSAWEASWAWSKTGWAGCCPKGRRAPRRNPAAGPSGTPPSRT